MRFWDQIWGFLRNQAPGLLTDIAVAIAIVVGAWIVASVVARAAARTIRRRSETLAGILRGLVKVTLVGVGLVMALSQLGINVGAVLAGAGVLGLAVGFGAQNLVKDVIAGFFLILDDVIRVGDVAQVGNATGVIEEVGLRMTRVRSFNGQLWSIPNGAITEVGNLTRGWARAIVEVGVAYEQDVGQGMKVLQGVGAAWAAEHADLVLEPPEAQGVMGLNASDVGLRLVVKVKPGEQFAAERALRAQVKAAFDAEGVEIPFPRQVVYHRQEQDPSPVPGVSPDGNGRKEAR